MEIPLRTAPTLFAILVLALLASHGEGVSVSAGRDFSQILTDEGRVLAAGRNWFGQLGINSSRDEEPEQTQVMLPEGATAVGAAAGTFHSLFLTATGLAYSVGRNNFGQLGVPGAAKREMPVLVEGLEDVVEVAAGYAHSLFLLDDGTVRAVGANGQGQLGIGEVSRSSTELVTPILPANITVKGIAAGYDFSFFLTEAGDVYAAGNGLGGQLGDGSMEIQAAPVKALGSILAVAAGESHGLFITMDKRLLGTGANFDGQLGISTPEAASTPVELIAGSSVDHVSAGGDSTCYITVSEAALFGMGSNRKGQLGLGPNVTRAMMPEQIEVDGNPSFAMASMGDSHGLYATTINIDAVYASGDNAYGQFGDGSLVSSADLLKVYQSPFTGTDTATASATATMQATMTVTDTATVTVTATESETVTTTATRARMNVQVDRQSALIAMGGVLAAGCVLGFVLNLGGRGGSGEAEVDDSADVDTEMARIELARARMAQEGQEG